MDDDKVIVSQIAYQNTSAGVEVFIKKEPLTLEDLDSDNCKDSSKAVEVTNELSDLETKETITKDECVQHKLIGSLDYEYTSSGIEVFIKEEPLTPEDIYSEEYEDSSKAVEVTPSITQELSDVRTSATIIKEECLGDAPYNEHLLGHIEEHYESMNAETHQLIIESPGNKSQEEYILPDIINNIDAIEETFKKEAVSYEKINEEPKDASFEENFGPISLKEEFGIFSIDATEQVSRRVSRPRIHKDYKFRESNSEASSSQEYTPEAKAPKQLRPHESTLLQSVLYKSRPKQTTTHEFALPEFETHGSLPRESLTHQSSHGQSKSQESEGESVSKGLDVKKHTSQESDMDKYISEDVQMHCSRKVRKGKRCEDDDEEDKKYSCKICRKTFLSYSNMARHLKYVHSDKMPFQCEICGRSFKRKYHLKTHSVIHSEAKPFSCNLCSKSFRYKQNLLEHELVHSGRRRYNCTHCDKGFNKKADFEKHQALHDGKKVGLGWECDECPESFGRWKEVVEHRDAHHRKNWLICDMCGNKFVRMCKLRSHMLTHTLSHQCDICKKNFSHASILKIHTWSHTGERPFPCTLCEKRFNRKYSLFLHMQSHTGERLFPCTLCEKRFRKKERLVEHMHMHTGVKPYACEKCDQTFTQRCNLNRHLKRKHFH